MTHLFISDLHLMESRTSVTEALLKFLRTEARDAESLYVLGDLFEVWLGDDHNTAFNQTIIEAFSALTCRRYVMHGNRDFLLGPAFCDATGMTLLPDPVVHDIDGQNTLLMHGDSLCTRDTQYMQARKMLRNPDFQATLLSKSLDERQQVAQGARAQSQSHTSETDLEIMDVTESEVQREMKIAGVTRMIHGHTHRPACHDVDLGDQSGTRIVLGDWDKQGWVLRINQNQPDLCAFPISD